MDPKDLKLTPFDDIIYKVFREDFPHLKIDVLGENFKSCEMVFAYFPFFSDENELKSSESKLKWRQFIEKFDKLDDFAFGTLIRSKSDEEFSPENSIFVVRVQFLAIE